MYARFLGFDVDLYERGSVAQHVLRWGHVKMFSPFRMNRSTLGLAALAAHDSTYQPPDEEAMLTGREWTERYLIPLSNTDLVADAVRPHTQVAAIGREGLTKTDHVGSPRRADAPFRILLRDENHKERIANADVVIDATGVYGTPNPMGTGGIAAIGEAGRRARVAVDLPDPLGRDRADYVGRHTLVIGGGYSAATTVVALSALSNQEPSTRVTWLVRRELPPGEEGPIVRIDSDPLAERDQLAKDANRCAAENPQITLVAGSTLHSIDWDPQRQVYHVQLSDLSQGPCEFDRVVSHTGFRPDNSLYRELQVHECYATGGPMNLAAWLLGQDSHDCLSVTSGGLETLRTTEPNFFILGNKSYGRNSSFLFSVGLDQIRHVFAFIGGRADLDLYANVGYLVP